MSNPAPFPLPYLVFNRLFFSSIPEFFLLFFSGHLLPYRGVKQVWILWSILFVVLHVSHLYRNTVLTLYEKILSFVFILIFLTLQTSFNIVKTVRKKNSEVQILIKQHLSMLYVILINRVIQDFKIS